jgi:hypothetical protein
METEPQPQTKMETESQPQTEPQEKKRRGRRKKCEMEMAKKEPVIPKKRGRKPKGGKLTNKDENNANEIAPPENVILHLDCNISDIKYQLNSNNLNYNPEMPPEIKTYNILEEAEYSSYHDNVKPNNFDAYFDANVKPYMCSKCDNKINRNSNDDEIDGGNVKSGDTSKVSIKELNAKLKEQKNLLYNGEMNGKMSACFWCTYEFDNNACYIPKCEDENKTDGYGSFCRPECAVAFLFNESIDDSIKFERYHLLNKIYSKVYDYKKNIKSAPDPHYLLDKFYGNLNIQEYRKLLSGDNLLFIIDKPMTRVFPELFEDNDNFILGVYGNGITKTATSNSSVYKVKRQSEKLKENGKANILNNKFGVTSA